MALNKTGLKDDINTLLKALLEFDNSPGKKQDDAIEKFKSDLADAIEKFVKTGTVAVPGAGLVAPSGGGPVTGQATGTIS